MQRRLAAATIAVLMSASFMGAQAVTARACAQGLVELYLSGLSSGNNRPARFYHTAEDGGSTIFRVERGSHSCDSDPSYVDFSTRDGTAVSGSGMDYTAVEGRAGPLYDPGHPEFVPPGGASYQDVPIEILSDGIEEDPLESATIYLSNPSGGTLGELREAPLYITDVDGSTRFTLAETSYRQFETYTLARIPIFRAGGDGPATVTFRLDPGPHPAATPGVDYEPPSEDTLTFASGERMKMISIKLIQDTISEPDENIEISLEAREAGTSVAGVGSTILTIQDDEEKIPPRSRFHHPRHGWRYRYTDYRIREMHVFATDEGGSRTVKRAQLALRRKMRTGRCTWWNGRKFVRGGCRSKRWVRMGEYKSGCGTGCFFFYYRIEALRPTAGTRIRSYTAFSRAFDAALNVESRFVKGRNRNTFTIRRR